uniref:Uncharacterized protein n=1 Tax=Oryza glumipatula TaxID=40148 RepID=A0A0D9YYK6_9ORYZ
MFSNFIGFSGKIRIWNPIFSSTLASSFSYIGVMNSAGAKINWSSSQKMLSDSFSRNCSTWRYTYGGSDDADTLPGSSLRTTLFLSMLT